MKRLAVAFLCLALLPAPLGAGTQSPRKIFRIGVLSVAPPSAFASASVPYARNLAAFRESLRDLGYVEGQNLVIEWRWAEGRYDRLPLGAEKSTTRTGEPEKSAVLVVPQSPAVVTSRATWWPSMAAWVPEGRPDSPSLRQQPASQTTRGLKSWESSPTRSL